MRRLGGLPMLLALAACAAPESPPAPETAAGIDVTIASVVDGDTLLVDGLGPGRELVRLIGIDAPETGAGRTTRECYGPEARSWLAGQAPRGSRVRLVADAGERDRFGRRLAYVHRPDGVFLNAALVENGYARTMTIRPNVRHASALQALEARARAGARGLWGACRDVH